MTSWLRNTSLRLSTAFWMLPIKVCCGCVYYSLRPVSRQRVVKSTELKLPFSERMLKLSVTRTNLWSCLVASLPRLIPPGTFWHHPVFILRYSTDGRDGEIVLTYYTRFSSLAVAHRHWSCSIKPGLYQSSWFVRPKLSSLRYPTTGSLSGKSSTGYVGQINTGLSESQQSSQDRLWTDEY